MNVLVSPYNIIRTYKDSDNSLISRLNGESANCLKIVNLGHIGQEEVMLNRDDYIFTEIDSKIVGSINYYYIDVNYKENDININK